MTSSEEHRILDASGLKCPQPILKLSALSPAIKPGEILEMIGDCPTFEKDVTAWCSRLKKTLLLMRDEGNYRKRALILF